MNLAEQTAIVTGTGSGGQAPEVVVPLVLHLAEQTQPTITGKVIKA